MPSAVSPSRYHRTALAISEGVESAVGFSDRRVVNESLAVARKPLRQFPRRYDTFILLVVNALNIGR